MSQITERAIETKQEDPIPFGLCVWSTGLAPNPLIESLKGVKKERKTKSLLTDAFCRAVTEDGKPIPNVYGIGDAAVIDGQMLPATYVI